MGEFIFSIMITKSIYYNNLTQGFQNQQSGGAVFRGSVKNQFFELNSMTKLFELFIRAVRYNKQSLRHRKSSHI